MKIFLPTIHTQTKNKDDYIHVRKEREEELLRKTATPKLVPTAIKK